MNGRAVNPAEEKMVSIDMYLRLFLLEKVFFFGSVS